MAPKRPSTQQPSSTTAMPASAFKVPQSTTSATQPIKSSRPSTQPTSGSSLQDAQQIVQNLWNSYVQHTPQRTKLLDAFLAFLIVVGVLQFVYCVVAGNYPFNAFLAGFAATVGQFVLTASLRLQTNPANQAEFSTISHERAFADFVFGSMILHFFCVNFIN